MTILYEFHNNLYVNLTNRCPCACTFCLRQTTDHMGGSGSLWLTEEPSAAQVIAEFDRFRMPDYDELVFCGFGEPTEALDVLLDVARHVKNTWPFVPVRINTNGLGSLIRGENIAPLFKGLIDIVSISLNTPDEARYLELTRSRFGISSFQAVLDFAGECSKYVPEVIMSTVATTITPEEEQKCGEICKRVGAVYRIRPFE